MNKQTHNEELHARDQRPYGFAVGLAAGAVVGTGLALWLAPRAAAELRNCVSDTAGRFGQNVAARYNEASDAVGEALDEVGRVSNTFRNDAADAVASGAREVERVAVGVKTNRL